MQGGAGRIREIRRESDAAADAEGRHWIARSKGSCCTEGVS